MGVQYHANLPTSRAMGGRGGETEGGTERLKEGEIDRGGGTGEGKGKRRGKCVRE